MVSLAALPRPALDYVDLEFPDPPRDRPYVLLNMVGSADGKAAVDGLEAGLSSRTDKLVLQSLRLHADAVINGAGTARLTGASPLIQNRHLREERRRRGRREPPLQVVISRHGQFDLDAPFLKRRDFDCVIFLAADAGAGQADRLRQSGRTVELLTPGVDNIREMLFRLRANYGVSRLALEGGPTLNSSFFHSGAVDEFFLTVSPHIVAGRDALTLVEGEPFSGETMPVLELLSAIPSVDTNEVYLHWRVRHDHAG